jgi:enoyl-CoA hydratase
MVLRQQIGSVMLLTLNRPAARNAVNYDLAAAIFHSFQNDDDAAAIVLTGVDPAFCSGLDLRALGVERLRDLPPFIDAVARCPVPVIAAVNGAAVTGGFELALACDFIVASERATFADTHLRVGVYPGPVLVELPRRVGMAWARQISLTGDFIGSETALRIGVANEVVAHAHVVDRAVELAESIAELDRDMVAAMRQDWDTTGSLPLFEAHRVHREWGRLAQGRSASAGLIAGRREAVMERAHRQVTKREP